MVLYTSLSIFTSIILTDSYKRSCEVGEHVLVPLIHRLKSSKNFKWLFLRQISNQIRTEEKSSKNFKWLFKGKQATELQLKAEIGHVNIASKTEVDF